MTGLANVRQKQCRITDAIFVSQLVRQISIAVRIHFTLSHRLWANQRGINQ